MTFSYFITPYSVVALYFPHGSGGWMPPPCTETWIGSTSNFRIFCTFLCPLLVIIVEVKMAKDRTLTEEALKDGVNQE